MQNDHRSTEPPSAAVRCRRQRSLIPCLIAAMMPCVRANAGEPPFYADKLDLLCYIDAQGREQPVKTPADWRIRRAHIVESMQLVMGTLPGDDQRVPLDVKILEQEETPKYIRQKITYAPEQGDRVPAYLLIPKGLTGKAPAMLCLHQSVSSDKGEPVGLIGLPNLHYAKELTERGYVTLTPDYPRYGDYPIDVYEFGYESVTMKGVWNHIRGLDLLQSLPEVDGDRIGCIGHSLGGYNTVFVSAFDERIKVVVSSCGFCSFFKYRGGRIEPWGSRTHHMPRVSTVYGNDPSRMPFDFTEVIAAIAPRPVFVNAPVQDGAFPLDGVKDCLKAARPVYGLLGAKTQLVAMHPEGGHDFPPEVRKAAYAFVDRALEQCEGTVESAIEPSLKQARSRPE